MTPLRGTVISSLKNPVIRETRRALERGTLTEEGWLVVEGPHLVMEAHRSGLAIEHILLTEDYAGTLPPISARQTAISRGLLAEISTTDHPQGIVAWVAPPVLPMAPAAERKGVTLLLDRLQDPGNLGAILRSAEAFGAAGVMALKGTVSLWNPKVLRASAGSAFRVPYVGGLSGEEALAMAAGKLYFADAGGARRIDAMDWSEAATIAIGNEGAGIAPELRAMGEGVRIPTRGVESLNAAIAAGILLYEAARMGGGQK